jgi:hypothetical protein
MLMVVFGAGASFDSVPHRPPAQNNIESRPPLANDLFGDRALFGRSLARFPACHAIVPDLRDLPAGVSLESVLEDFQAEAETYGLGIRQLAAVRYYLQCMIGECESQWESEAAQGITNYKTLLDRINRFRKPGEPVCLVTFNYDTMLERALLPFDVSITSLEGYVNNKTWKLFKLHGSVNWGRQIETLIDNVDGPDEWTLAGRLIDQAADLTLTEQYWLVNQRPLVRYDGRAMLPALAIPLERKTQFECPAYHLEALKLCLPEVDKILVIGWRATDTPFLELLRTTGRQAIRGLVVAGDADKAAEVIGNLKNGLDRPGEFRASAGGFTDLIKQRGADEFLKM